MEPQIQYARTAEGVSIAYTTVGDGPPLLYCPNMMLSLQHVLSDGAPLDLPVRLVVGLITRTRLTFFDPPGTGASQRDVSDFSFDAQVRAIEAVASRIADRPFTLVGHNMGATVAALYAARHPEHVRGLACVYPNDPDLSSPRASAVRENWAMFRRHVADGGFPEGPVSSQRWLGQAIRESVAAEVAAAYFEEHAPTDVKEIYRRVPVPTLVCVQPRQPARAAEIALASLVPDCRVAVAGHSQVADAILAFMGIAAAQVNPSAAPSTDARGTATILFTDLVDHTLMMRRLGDVAGRAVLREHERITREVLSQHRGAEVKTDGDSFMVAFSSATAAVACAIDLQRAFAARNESADEPIIIRAGLNVGEPIEEGGDYFGSAVILAARIKDQAGAGEILAPEAVRHLLSGKNFVFADRGDVLLKGFEDPVRLCEVRWRD